MSEIPAPCESAAALLMLLVRVSAALEARLERSVEPWGLSLAKVGALHHLASAPGPLPLGQLADRLCCVRSNVTQLVDRLEADGLVRRVPDPSDRRSVLAAITPAGRERFTAARAAKEQAQAGMLAGLDDAERETLRRLLQRLDGAADRSEPPHPLPAA
ncbi:MAG TPA: MarR family transcriptional regulator [Longimicrobiaceae bacterium]|nr:MarR family transcriptional regulator [Longimicrobiaceae bacterium]